MLSPTNRLATLSSWCSTSSKSWEVSTVSCGGFDEKEFGWAFALLEAPTAANLPGEFPIATTLLGILHHPMYAGAYVYGRRKSDPTLRVPGKRRSGRRWATPDEWESLIRDALPAYITWEQLGGESSETQGKQHQIRHWRPARCLVARRPCLLRAVQEANEHLIPGEESSICLRCRSMPMGRSPVPIPARKAAGNTRRRAGLACSETSLPRTEPAGRRVYRGGAATYRDPSPANRRTRCSRCRGGPSTL